MRTPYKKSLPLEKGSRVSVLKGRSKHPRIRSGARGAISEIYEDSTAKVVMDCGFFWTTDLSNLKASLLRRCVICRYYFTKTKLRGVPWWKGGEVCQPCWESDLAKYDQKEAVFVSSGFVH